MSKYLVFLGNASYGAPTIEADEVVWSRDDVMFRTKEETPDGPGAAGVVARFNRGDVVGYLVKAAEQ